MPVTQRGIEAIISLTKITYPLLINKSKIQNILKISFTEQEFIIAEAHNTFPQVMSYMYFTIYVMYILLVLQQLSIIEVEHILFICWCFN